MKRIVFMGSPDFATATLDRLAKCYSVVGVVTQPDRPAGRGRSLTPPPVKILAQSLGIDIIQPTRLRDIEALMRLNEWAPDLIVVTAFGQILRKSVLDLPRFGCINVHASLLPRWRGAAPIQASILNGDRKTGATIMLMDPGVDTGPILSQQEIDINPDDTSGSLSERLARLGADLLIETLPRYLNGDIHPQQQDETVATFAPMLSKDEGLLDFTHPAEALERRVRAFNPWPGAYMNLQGQPLKIHRAQAAAIETERPGQRMVINGLPAVSTPTGCLVLIEVQPSGKRNMFGQDFLRGARQWAE